MAIFPKSDVTVTFSNRTIVRVIVLIVATLLGLQLLKTIAQPLILIFVAFFLALALNPAVSWIAGKLKSNSRVRATGAAYILVLAVLISFFSLVIPPLVSETRDFVTDLPATIDSFKTQDSTLAEFVRNNNLDQQLSDLSNDFRNRFSDFRQPLINTAGRIGSMLISTVTVLVLTFMMLVEGPRWLERLLAIQPAAKRERYKKLSTKMYRAVTGYVNGQLLVALIGAGFALVALLIASTVLDVSINAVALAGIVALTGLIPLIGNTLGAVLVVLVCLFSSATLAIVMAVFFLIYQQVENATIQPYIQAKTNELTPLLVFIAALLGANIAGLLGALVAIPTASCIKILLEDFYARRSTAKT